MVAIFESVKNSQKMASLEPISGSVQKLAFTELICGKDLGAGFGKGIYGQNEVVIPSAYLRVRDRNAKHHETIGRDGCWLRYRDGDRKDLTDVQWFWGTAAVNKDPKNYVKLHEDTKSKAGYALESILADLAVLDIPSETDIVISLSSHNPEKWSDDIRRNISGIHAIEHLRNDASRNRVEKTYKITVNDIYPEGYGSIAYCLFGGESENSLALDESEIAIGLDFGTSTVIVTVFDGMGSVIDRELIEGGSGELYQCIADTLDKQNTAANKLMRDTQHKISEICAGVEQYTAKSKFIYGASALVGKPFDQEYRDCFKGWLDTRIEQIANFVSGAGYLDRAKYIACWGGAAQLPGMTEELANYDVVFLPKPQTINAKGLQLLTQASIGA